MFYIKRKKLTELIEALDTPEIVVLIGPRQSGKTTLLKELTRTIIKRGEKFVFLNLDIEADYAQVRSQITLLQYLKLELGTAGGTVIIDEIQRKENAGIFLKGLYDLQVPYKFIVSGSGSLELKAQVHESLAGRKRLISLQTVNFQEFLNFKTGYKYEQNLTDYATIYSEYFEAFTMEYLMFGGYPKVILADTLAEKQQAMQEIYQSYLLKDISQLLNVTKFSNFSKLVEYLALTASQPLNFNQLLSNLEISRPTLEKYVYYLEQTFIISLLRPFFTNKLSELTKIATIYFQDLGMLNFARHEFNSEPNFQELGLLFQAFIYRLLADQLQDSLIRISYWRTKAGNEVDFIVEKGALITPVEVKYQTYSKPQLSKSYQNFLKLYKPVTAYLINRNLTAELKFEATTVKFRTPVALLLEEIS